ncbi:hypothetical protein SAMN05421676_10265 [Salinibacillus kushneri]|uniref:Uncharacterized protein n=1 Tax=Salinibacillus kushneri TaxID=237682 RepID=A0A1I0A7U2_9BACI|nr:DUF6220 domain-containing protein [Salinibacillus kushneri]SES90238.1 hypothetical protein SAMN05421676_10265 [Salinibacillus kushneri]
METINLRVRIGRIVYLILAILFALSVVIQIFLAGMAIFISPVNWMKHMIFVHLFGFNIPIFMFIFAFIGALPRFAYWQLLGMLTLIFLMYFTANITTALPWLGAMHPVFGVLLFVLSYKTVRKIWKFTFDNNRNQKGEA